MSMYRPCTGIVATLIVMVYTFLNLAAGQEKIAWWDAQRKGANWFNAAPSLEWMVSAKAAGIQVVRLTPAKWKSVQRDFLIGNADQYHGIVETDFDELKITLDQADSLGLRIVLTMLSLPGARWTQHNGGKPDLRLWKDTSYRSQAAAFWKDLAIHLKDHQAIAGYNILNEPIPEITAGIRGGDPDAILQWYNRIVHTAADLNDFNAAVVHAIREVDANTPIVIDCGLWSQPEAVGYLEPIADHAVLYAFHCYDPYEYTNKKSNNGRFSFPGPFPSEDAVSSQQLDTAWLERHFEPVVKWQMEHAVPASRIFIEEFGCNRQTKGIREYLSGLINIFNRQHWHWAFYSFREDFWDGMDYEMGTGPAGERYWNDVEKGITPHPHRGLNPIWNMLHTALIEKQVHSSNH